MTIKEVVHDTTFVTVPDTATYKALLDCQNGKVVVKEVLVNSEGKNHLKKPKVKIEDNKLSVDCEARAQELFAKWKSEQKTEVHETVRNIYHEVEKSLTWWQLFQIWCGRLLLIVIMLFLIIKYLVKVYKPI
ncbi:hypothetical protein E5F92_009165 [Flavobacterium columnare]|uniref:hypothetical protein n=1 Tax=Flavobacterium columnare TaxID=996 RepID=UPI002989F7BC|nr:hypothetical protein [Flavobacterium columnare]MCH4832834.1 hypothetical protein [Flavobacterium columnare]